MTYSPGDQDTRPWGSWEVLATGHGYVVKRIYINPLQRLSLQTHEHRDEVWTVLIGPVLVEVDGQERVVQSGATERIPRGASHRATALSTTAVILEAQLGITLSEDDIVRLSDDYGRNTSG
jgi:mannose-6-phosphate isomerase